MSHNVMKIIPFDDKYEFEFLEEYEKNPKHPVSNYYLKLDDLSINLLISLKWIKWGYFFFKSIKNELDNLDNDFKIEKITETSIQKLKEEKKEKILIIDNKEIQNDYEFEKNLNEFYLDNDCFDKNTKIHLKLKLNLSEYLIISNMLYPTLIKWKIKII